MGIFKIPEKIWKWAFLAGVLIFYLSSMMAIVTDKGIYSQVGAALLVGIIVFYLISSNRR